MNTLVQWLLVALLLSWAGNAEAVTGTISGTLKFRGIQAHYCDTTEGMDCTAARFPVANATGYQPVKNADVVLRDENGAVVGEGSTNRAGQFTTTWQRSSTPTSIVVRLYWRHVDDRFRITTDTGSQYYSNMATTTPVVNQNVSIGSRWTSADDITNLYDGAERTWYEALSYSGLMTDYFTGIQVRYQNIARGAYAVDDAYVSVGADHAELPDPIISHELGHIAAYVARPFYYANAANYPAACMGEGTPASCTGDGWYMTDPEWAAFGFEEALATFIGDVSYYWYYATDPRVCIGLSATRCQGLLEPSAGDSCTSSERRVLFNSEKYLWDAYDTGADGNYTDSVSVSYWEFFSGLAAFPDSTSDGGFDEPWNSSRTFLDAPNGRGAQDMKKYLHSYNWTLDQWNYNCAP